MKNLKEFGINYRQKKQYILESLAKTEYKRKPEFQHRTHFVRSQTEDEEEDWEKYFMDPKDSEI